MTRQTQGIQEFGPYRLDAAKRLLLRAGEVVPLTPKCFEILLVLVENSGEVIDKQRLMNRVWPDSFVEEGNLTYNISVLRKALGERANEHHYIVTVPGRGYQFVAGVTEVSLDGTKRSGQAPSEAGGAFITKPALELNEAVVESRKTVVLSPVMEADKDGLASPTERESVKKAARIGRHKFVAVVVITLVAFIGAGAYLLSGRNSQRPPSTVAVLPFANSSGNPDMEYLSDGISESLINSLSQLPGIKVIARSSSYKYKGQEVDPKEAARTLGVEAILTGRVTLLGDNLLISTELTDARDNTQIWGAQYNRKASDLLSMQTVISGEIAKKLRLKLTNAEQQQLARHETVNPQAYEMLLRGRLHREKSGTENLKRAVEDFKRAITIDPAYAGAYAELCVMYTLLSSRGILDPKEYLPQAEAAGRKALELDDNLAEVHFALANLQICTWDWVAAAGNFERAFELNPGLARARFRYSFYLSVMRQHDQALAEMERARELDPLSLRFKANVGLVLFLARRYDEAVDVLQSTLAMDQSFGEAQTHLALTYAAKGMYPEAIAAYQEAVKLGDDLGLSTQIHLGAAYARAGQREKAQAILRRLLASKEYVSSGLLPILYIALGEREQAFTWLERAYAEHDLQLQYLGLYPGFDPIRSDPRFIDLMRRVGLPQ